MQQDPARTIAFQGAPGAYSDLACRVAYPRMTTLPCASFEDAFAAVEDGQARLAMIPIDNSVAGRVADIHHLLPFTRLHIIAEHFQPVNHHLLARPGATLEGLRRVHSHVHALSQCRRLIRKLGLQPVVHADTAGAAAEVAGRSDPTEAAIASALAAETYGLVSLMANIEDADHNTTRFIVLSRDPSIPDPSAPDCVTSFIFRVRNVPAALYKAMGGFATNGVNMTKLESYMVDGAFVAAQFYAEIDGHPDQVGPQHAFDELRFFSHEMRILGVYPAHPFRRAAALRASQAAAEPESPV
jgi:prephenate dehydratase